MSSRPTDRKVIAYYGFTHSAQAPRNLEGVLNYRRRHDDIDLHLYMLDVHKSFENAPQPVWRNKVDGTLIGAAVLGPADDVVQWVRSGGVPAVSMVSNILDPRLPIVVVDPESVVRLAIDELLRCGCRSLVFVGYAPSQGSALRGDAFERLAAKTGLRVARVDGDWSFESEGNDDRADRMALANVLESAAQPIGVHTLNDSLGRRVLDVCNHMELDVPGDVAIVTADDTPLAYDRRPTLTSVCYPGEAIGARAAELLDGLIAGRRAPRKPTLVPATDIVVRESTGGALDADDVVRALEIIRSKATQGLKIQDLADSLSISRRTLERAFRDRLERSPAAEIQRIRMSTARRMLKETKFSVGRIAVLVGYVETAAFSSAFHRDTGFSPKEYRNQSE